MKQVHAVHITRRVVRADRTASEADDTRLEAGAHSLLPADGEITRPETPLIRLGVEDLDGVEVAVGPRENRILQNSSL